MALAVFVSDASSLISSMFAPAPPLFYGAVFSAFSISVLMDSVFV